MAVSSAWSVPSSLIRQLAATSVDQSRYGCPTSYSATSSSSRIVAPLRKLHIGRHSSSIADGIHSHVRRQGSAIRASQEASTLFVPDVVLVWRGPGSEVLLTGEFLKWIKKLGLEKISNGVFILKQNLGLGNYAYKFIVDGEWKRSPDCPTIPDGSGGLNNEVIVTDQNTRESALPSVSVETSESDSAGKSGNDDDGAKSEAEKSTKSPESSSSSTSKVQKNDGEDETEASAKPSQKVDASTSTDTDDGANKLKTPSEPSQKAGEKVTAVGETEAPPKKADGKKAEAKGPAVVDKAESSPKKAEAATSTKKSAADKSDSDDKSSTTQRPRPAAKKAPAKSFEATMLEDVVPQLTSTLEGENGLADLDVSFEDNQLKAGFVKDGIPYCFWAFFPDGSLTGARGSALTSHGVPPSTIEPFLVDEKKITAELIVFWVTKRLFVQNLLSIN